MDFEAFAQGSTEGLLRFAIVLTGDGDMAQDVVQEVLLRAFARWDAISVLPYPYAYVRKMVANETISWRRKWGRIRVGTDSELDRAVFGGEAAIDSRDELLALLSRLPGRQRAAIVMRYFEDMDDDAIAAALGCRAGTVRGYLHRGLKALRIDLESPDPIERPRTESAHHAQRS